MWIQKVFSPWVVLVALLVGAAALTPPTPALALSMGGESYSSEATGSAALAPVLAEEVSACALAAGATGAVSAAAAVEEGGCFLCGACVVVGGFCIGTGSVAACVASIPSHAWVGVLAACVEACADCFSEEE